MQRCQSQPQTFRAFRAQMAWSLPHLAQPEAAIWLQNDHCDEAQGQKQTTTMTYQQQMAQLRMTTMMMMRRRRPSRCCRCSWCASRPTLGCR